MSAVVSADPVSRPIMNASEVYAASPSADIAQTSKKPCSKLKDDMGEFSNTGSDSRGSPTPESPNMR